MPYSDGAVSPIRSGPKVPKKKKKRDDGVKRQPNYAFGLNTWENQLKLRLIVAKIVIET